MEIRPRADADVDGAMTLLARVHVADGYPSTMAEGTAFLVPAYEVAAWVAIGEEGVVGHVALHRPPDSATAAAASLTTGLEAEQHLVLSRLFTSPDRRGQGVGKRLLAAAQAEAERRGQRAVLDVGTAFPAAAALYESAGWLRVAEDRQKVGDAVFDVWVYVAPTGAAFGRTSWPEVQRSGGTVLPTERSLPHAHRRVLRFRRGLIGSNIRSRWYLGGNGAWRRWWMRRCSG